MDLQLCANLWATIAPLQFWFYFDGWTYVTHLLIVELSIPSQMSSKVAYRLNLLTPRLL